MSLSDKLSKASEKPSSKCKLGALLASTALPEKDRSYLTDVLSVPEGDPRRISNVDIARVLRDEGFYMSDSSVDRHRRKDCSCYRKAA
jgi:hypothetical protein